MRERPVSTLFGWIPSPLVIVIVVVGSVVAWHFSNGDVAVTLGVPGVAALIYAVMQSEDARETLRRLDGTNFALRGLADEFSASSEEIQGSLLYAIDDLEEQLTVQRLGAFPEFLEDIVALLRSANHSIWICCDNPAYGVLSAPAAHSEYIKAIRARSRAGVSVSLLHNGPQRQDELHRQRIEREGGWAIWRRDPDVRNFIKRNCSRIGATKLHTLPEAASEDQLLELLVDADKQVLNHAFTDVTEVVETRQVLPLYFWLIDPGEVGQSAIFALAPLIYGNALEVGFCTEEVGMLSAIHGIFARYREQTDSRTY